ncbi:Glyoxalase/Bleomycin resistance protein/Dihydroxybiphenyl dioxygenase [Sistotremastrum suecicum HHB10207 ss-3]|uniref:Glyoxalase/Bleomycin resistance protein/Dihydroxybiphenyl dioxygenase n=1 Tax=Sistotremastrum suecicum HHB10207 ss-3 TaxID=1314776 RepID=A0A166A9G1_9AGAM|nr:Glyoxalase/Bleomycin resistance protein/Dihydroxybiphenyl dioxygenase [Sistotremastrum suecicum HHB10207 ss-3]
MTYYETNPKRRAFLGHLSFGVRDMSISKPFYIAIFEPFGIGLVYDDGVGGCTGYGVGDWEWINLFRVKPLSNSSPASGGESAQREELERLGSGRGTHIAFNAPSREAVDGFYKAALENGGRGDGAPGVRKDVHKNYYACYVYDPDGHRLEAVYQESVKQ